VPDWLFRHLLSERHCTCRRLNCGFARPLLLDLRLRALLQAPSCESPWLCLVTTSDRRFRISSSPKSFASFSSSSEVRYATRISADLRSTFPAGSCRGTAGTQISSEPITTVCSTTCTPTTTTTTTIPHSCLSTTRISRSSPRI